jgi:hypothetical protein
MVYVLCTDLCCNTWCCKITSLRITVTHCVSSFASNQITVNISGFRLQTSLFLLLCLIVRSRNYYMFMYFFHVYVFIVCSCIFIVPAGTLRLPWLKFFLAFSSVVSKCQGKTRKDGARPALFLNFCVVLCIVCFVSFYVLCTELLSQDSYPTAAKKYIISYHIISVVTPEFFSISVTRFCWTVKPAGTAWFLPVQ